MSPLLLTNAIPSYAFLGHNHLSMPTNVCLPQKYSRYISRPPPVKELLSDPNTHSKARLSGDEIYPRPLAPEPVMTVLARELEPGSRTYTPPGAVLTSHRMSESYLSGRPLSPSFLSLTPSPAGYQPPEYISSPSDYNYNSSSEYPSSFEYPSPEPGYQLPSAYHSPPSICVSASSRVKPTKRKPPPLILSDSFHSTSHQSHTLAVLDTNPAPLSPLFTPVSPQCRMMLSEKEQFRRRLLKLQRTLGEQITPGLVIRPKPSPELTDHDPPHQRPGNPISDYLPTKRSALYAPNDQDLLDLGSSLSKNLPLLSPTAYGRKTSAPSPNLQSFPRHYLPETVTLTPMTLTAFVDSVSTPRTPPTARSFEFVLDYDVQDSWFSDDDESPGPIFSFNDDYDEDSCPPSPFHSDWSPTFFDVEGDTVLVDVMPRCWGLETTGRDEVSDTTMPDTPGVARRQEARHGWSGEWNQPHIQVVIEKLRSL